MSDYNYDAAMDQQAEWEEEILMEEYNAQKYNEYLTEIDAYKFMASSPDSFPKIAWETDVSYANNTEGSDATTTILQTPYPVTTGSSVVTDSKTETILLQKIEKEAEQKIIQIVQQNEPIDTETCVNIMKQGADEFKKNTGRNMTYSEMRNAFG